MYLGNSNGVLLSLQTSVGTRSAKRLKRQRQTSKNKRLECLWRSNANASNAYDVRLGV